MVGPETVKTEVVPGKVIVVKDPDIDVVIVGPGTRHYQHRIQKLNGTSFT